MDDVCSNRHLIEFYLATGSSEDHHQTTRTTDSCTSYVVILKSSNATICFRTKSSSFRIHMRIVQASRRMNTTDDDQDYWTFATVSIPFCSLKSPFLFQWPKGLLSFQNHFDTVNKGFLLDQICQFFLRNPFFTASRMFWCFFRETWASLSPLFFIYLDWLF